MKQLAFGFLFLGLTTLMYSQNNNEAPDIILEAVVIKPLNLSYLRNVQEKETPVIVKNLENVAARYDITEKPIFEKEFEAYEVVFKTKKKSGTTGRITATYDSKGKILNSVERYKDVLLPVTIRKAISNKYPGWIIYKDVYLVRYQNGKEARKVFRIQIRKDGKKKNLKMDYQGNID